MVCHIRWRSWMDFVLVLLVLAEELGKEGKTGRLLR